MKTNFPWLHRYYRLDTYEKVSGLLERDEEIETLQAKLATMDKGNAYIENGVLKEEAAMLKLETTKLRMLLVGLYSESYIESVLSNG